MTVDVVRVQTLTAPAGEVANYVQRFTFKNSGEVKGYTIATTSTDVPDTTLGSMGMSFGFSDGTNDYGWGGSCVNASQSSECILCNDRSLITLSFTAGHAIQLEVITSAIGVIAGTNDGYVDLQWVTPPAGGDDRPVTVQAFCGSTVTCGALDVETPATTGSVEAAFGFKPSCGILLSNCNSAMVGSGVFAHDHASVTEQMRLSIGMFDDSSDASPAQGSVTWFKNNGASEVVSRVSTIAGVDISSTGPTTSFLGGGVQVQDLDSNGFDLHNAEIGNDEAQNYAIFAVQMNGTATYSTITTPTSPAANGTHDESQSTYTQSIFTIPTRVTTVNSDETGTNAGVFGLSFADRLEQVSYAAGFDDAGTTGFCRFDTTSYAKLPLDDGTLGTDHFDYVLDSFEGAVSFNTHFTYEATATDAGRKWPTLHFQHDQPAGSWTPTLADASAAGNASSFGGSMVEQFENPVIEPILLAITSGGTLTLDNDQGLGVIDCSGGSLGSNAAYWVDQGKLTPTSTWAVRATIRFESGITAGHADVLSILNDPSPPPETVLPGSVFDPNDIGPKRLQCGLVTNAGGDFAQVGYFGSGGNQAVPIYGDGIFWNGAGDAWGVSSGEEDAVAIRKGASQDFYTFTIFNDGENERFCFIIQNSHEATVIGDDRQGEIGVQTDWVDWSAFSVPIDDLYVVLGDHWNNHGDSEYSVYMYERDIGSMNPIRGIVNCKDDETDDFFVRETVGADKVYVIADRDTDILTDAETYGDEGIYKRTWFLDDDDTIYFFYTAYDLGGAAGPRDPGGAGETRIKRVSSTDGGATWTSPVTILGPADVNATGYQIVDTPYVVKFNEHPTAAERCMLFISAEVDTSTKNERRMFVFTAANLSDNTWTKKAGAGTNGAILEGTGTDTDHDHSGYSDPVVTGLGGAWHMMAASYHDPAAPSGGNPMLGFQIVHLTSVDAGTPVTWTEGASPPHIANDVDGTKIVTSMSARAATVTTTLHDKNQPVYFRYDVGDEDAWGLFRIFQRTSGTALELLQEPENGTESGDSAMAIVGQGSISPHSVRVLPGGDIELIGTARQPFVRSDTDADGAPEELGSAETTLRWTSTDYETWTVDYQHAPMVIPIRQAGRVVGNFSPLLAPVGVPTELDITTPPLGSIHQSGTQSILLELVLVPVEEVIDTSTQSFITPGVRRTYSDQNFLTNAYALTTDIDAWINISVLDIDSSGTQNVEAFLGLTPLIPPLDIIDATEGELLIDLSASTASAVLGLTPELAPGDLPGLPILRSGSTFAQTVYYLEFFDEEEFNPRVTQSGSCVVAELELVPICGKIDDVCEQICVLDIWNATLVQLGLPTQNDQSATNKYLDRIRLSWTRVRKGFLRNAHFNGSSDSRLLIQISEGASHRIDYGYAYELPSCYIKAVSINGINVAQEGDDFYEIATSKEHDRRVLYSDEPTVNLKYIEDIRDINQLDAAAQTALIYLLAIDIAPAFKDVEEIEALRARYQKDVLEARTTDSQENSPDEFADYTDNLWMNT